MAETVKDIYVKMLDDDFRIGVDLQRMTTRNNEWHYLASNTGVIPFWTGYLRIKSTTMTTESQDKHSTPGVAQTRRGCRRRDATFCTASGPPTSNWRQIIRTQEAGIFSAGIFTALILVAWFLILSTRDPAEAAKLAAVIGSHLTGGRAAGMFLALGYDLPRSTAILLGTLIESSVVCIFFSLFSLSFKKLITRRFRFLNDTMAQIHRSATDQRWRLLRWGIPGLLLFVWFPFFMTGPVMGSVIGFLLGMQPWVTVCVVLLGTMLALISWSFLIGPIVEWIAPIGQFLPMIIVMFLLIFAASYRMRKMRETAQQRRQTSGTDAGSGKDSGSSGLSQLLLLGSIALQVMVATGCVGLAPTATVHVDLSHVEIRVPPQPPIAVQQAAAELRVHLEALGKTSIPVMATVRDAVMPHAQDAPYLIIIGTGIESAQTDGKMQKYGYTVSKRATSFHWRPETHSSADLHKAVAAFLENECGIHWIYPGDSGVVLPDAVAGLNLRSGHWRPQHGAGGFYAPTTEENTIFRTLLTRIEDQTGFDAAAIARRPVPQREWLIRNRAYRSLTSVAPERILSPLSMVLPTGDHAYMVTLARTLMAKQSGPIRVDGCPGFIGTNMLRDYALVQLLADSDSKISTSRQRFLQSFGSAAQDVARYVKYWEEFFGRTVRPVLDSGRSTAEISRRLATTPGEFYTPADFRNSLAYLHQALQRPVTDSEKARLELLVFAHQHAEKTFQTAAMLASSVHDPAGLSSALSQARFLHKFRRDFSAQLGPCLPYLIAQEVANGDVTGYELAPLLEELKLLKPLAQGWHAKLPDLQVSPTEIQPVQLTQWPIVRDHEDSAAPANENARVASTLFAAPFMLAPQQAESNLLFLVLWSVRVPCKIYMNGRLLGEARPSFGRVPATMRLPVTSDVINRDGPQLIAIETRRPVVFSEVWRGAWLCLD